MDIRTSKVIYTKVNRQVGVSITSVNNTNLLYKKKAIFLDRDGTINKDVGILCNINEFELLSDVAKAIKKINGSDYYCIVITNQPAVALGCITTLELNAVHNKLVELLKIESAYIDALYYCPHGFRKDLKSGISELLIDCDCHKPKPGMFLEAAKDFSIDLSKSWMIGDTENDIKAGKNAGCKTALVSPVEKNLGQDLWAESLLFAVNDILAI